jgi:Ca2+-binding EF-hand superfamily protein
LTNLFSTRSCHADLKKNGLTTKSFDECFGELDSDGSGEISFNEYINWVTLVRIEK